MKKTLLAAALLVGFAGAGVAQAETSVTLYGIVDTGYGYQNYKWDKDVYSFYNDQDQLVTANFAQKATSSGLRDGTFNGNRFGLKGSEDLGDGLRAIFQLEQGFNIGNGTAASSSRQFHRQSFVGLSSDSWGTFTMGRQYSAGVDTNLAANGVNLGDMDKVFGGVGLGGDDRVDNSFKYVTPNMSGFQAIVLYGNPNTTVDRFTWSADTYPDITFDNSERTNRVSVGLKYANGPIAVGAAYDRASVQDMSAITNWNINASYDFEVVKLSLAYGQDRNGKLGWAGASGNYLSGFPTATTFDDFKSNNYHVGLSAPLGGGTLYAGWNYSTSNLDDSDKAGSFAGNISTYHINYFYPLSKRTAVYAYGTYGKNLGYVDNLKGTEAGIGVNHKF